MGNHKIWTTKDRQKIKIKDMTDSHLRNTVEMLRKRAVAVQTLMPFPNFNGEMAQFCAEQNWDRLQDMDPDEVASEMFDLYDDLMTEALRREILFFNPDNGDHVWADPNEKGGADDR